MNPPSIPMNTPQRMPNTMPTQPMNTMPGRNRIDANQGNLLKLATMNKLGLIS